MNCFFCQQPCIIAPYDGRWPPGDIWECTNHTQIVKHYISETYHAIHEAASSDCCPHKYFHVVTVDWSHKGKDYQINWFMPYPIREMSLSILMETPSFRVDVNNPNGKGGWVIFTLPFHPTNLTPENMDEKLPLWLMLS